MRTKAQIQWVYLKDDVRKWYKGLSSVATQPPAVAGCGLKKKKNTRKGESLPVAMV